MIFDLSGRVALVTGAGQNVGAGVARMLSEQGASVAINDLFEDRAKSIADELAASGGASGAFAFDVADGEAVARGVAEIERALGPIDILVNNAGVPIDMRVSSFRKLPPESWKGFIDVNLYGVLHCSRAVLDGMLERGHGRIITISSAAGQTGIGAGVSVYGAAKAGGIGFSRHLAMEVASRGVTVNCVSLGLMSSGVDSEIGQRLAATIPAKRIGEPQDVAAAVVYLASDEASWVTGQNLGVNGGSHMP